MAEDFARAVEDGIRLSKRIYFGKDRAVAPPKPILAMDKAGEHSYLPSAVMVYAIIGDPSIVDNPDIPSYQPHVHGRCDPPALIPLQMNGISLEADCYFDTAFVTVSGSWRVHCVMGSRSCDCRIAIPMGEQGSILGIEVAAHRKSYRTQLTGLDDIRGSEKIGKTEDGSFLTPYIFTLTIPQVDGGLNLSIKVRWSQKLLYNDGQFTLNIPFSFPEFVVPAGKKISKKEKILLNVNCGPGTEILCKTTSHPLKELKRQAGRLGFSYEAEVLSWSSYDLVFAYTIASSQTCGGILVQSPALDDVDQRDIFCCYFLPSNQQTKKVFRKEVVFVVDISGSMRGKPLENTKSALFASLSKLDPQDLFNVIAFAGETFIFSSSLELATSETIEKVTGWINMNFVAGGGTNILLPLTQAIKMFSDTGDAIPMIFLITDGSVGDERHICEVMKAESANKRKICPRIYTFGIGSFCNHYFLRMLAMVGRGYHDAAYDADSIEVRLEGLFARMSSICLANVAFQNLHDFDEFKVYPSELPDVSSKSPWIVSGRYRGKFPDSLAVTGIFSDMGRFSAELKVHAAKDMPLDKILAKQETELLTAEAWFTENKELEAKIAKMSIQKNSISEFTQIVLVETEILNKQQVRGKNDPKKADDQNAVKIIVLRSHGIGFGNLTATMENIPPGSSETKPIETAEIIAKAASNCCGRLCDICCCMCCIRVCSKMNDQCAIALTQLFGALACLGCASCCEACCGQD